MALTDGILSYWNLNNDASGGVSLLDATGNGYTLSNVNGVTLGTGIIGGDAVFTGANGQYLGPVSFGTQNSYSIGVWLKWSGASSGGNQIFYSSVSDLGIQTFFDEATGKIQVANYGTSPAAFNTNVSIPTDGGWHYYVFTQDGDGNFNFYLDGTSVYTNTFVVGSVLGGYPTGLGSESVDLTQAFNGGIDEVGTWSRDLSPTEVSDLYYGGQGNTYPFTNPLPVPLTAGCKAYWNFNNNGSGGVSLLDSTGNGITLNNNGNVALGTGIIAGGASFTDTTSNWLQTTNGDFATHGPWSFTTWVNPIDYGTSSFGYNGCIVELGTGGGSQGWLGLFSTSGNLCIINRLSSLVYTSQNPIPLNSWTNITITFTGDSGGLVSSVYINGVLDGSVTSAFGYLDTNAVTFGTAYDQTGTINLSYNGVIDESGFWNRALSQSDITFLYNNGSGRTYPFLTLYYNNAQSDGDWGNLLNWWQDSGFTLQATALPTSTNQVFIYGDVLENTSGDGVCYCQSAEFHSSSFYYPLVLNASGSVNCYGNSGVFDGTCTNGISFRDSSSLGENGVVTGNASFYDQSVNGLGTITGNAYFYGQSYNSGHIVGNATVNYSEGGGSYPIGGTVDGSVSYVGWPANNYQWFNDSTSIDGAGDGDFNNLANWWSDNTFTARPLNVTGTQVLPDPSTDIFIASGSAIYSNTGPSNPTVNSLTADSAELAYISLTVTNGADFSGDNWGMYECTIYGNVAFHSGAYNQHSVIQGNASYSSPVSLVYSFNANSLQRLSNGGQYGSNNMTVTIAGSGGSQDGMISRLLRFPWFINF
jgi:hypothetical protein